MLGAFSTVTCNKLVVSPIATGVQINVLPVQKYLRGACPGAHEGSLDSSDTWLQVERRFKLMNLAVVQ